MFAKSTFFLISEKINEATRRYTMLKTELKAYKDSLSEEKQGPHASVKSLGGTRLRKRSTFFGTMNMVR